jgi:hypothetical protein
MMATWTIYDHPLDFPHAYVARKFMIEGGKPEPVPTTDVLVSDTLETLRAHFAQLGLTPIRRSDGDSPSIVETWL